MTIGYAANLTVQQNARQPASSGDYILKQAEHGANKLAEKVGEALEKYAYKQKVVSWDWRDPFDSD